MTVRVRELWERWGTYQSHRRCNQCRRPRLCRSPNWYGRWLCHPCFHNGPEEARFIRLLHASNGDAEHAAAVERVLR